MAKSSILSQWKTDPSVAPNFTAWQIIPKRNPVFEDFPPQIDSRLKSHLLSLGISSLYAHQLKSWNEIQSGSNIVLATGTASGKSLAYHLPILSSLYEDKDNRSLLLFPTKALAHDQLEWLSGFPDISAQAYDGDTPGHKRSSIRQNSQLVVSNPDMLHLGILPYHIQWADFFTHLKFVVLDEMHIYRGVFGSHVANVIRRLKRVTSFYGSSPQYILTSATIGNPQELAEALLEEKVILIGDDFSSRGEKHFLIYNPPIIDSKLGLRASMQKESIRLTSDLISAGYQTILFGRSRPSVEFMLTSLREKDFSASDKVKSYRSGYLPSRRREIENGLRSGVIRGVTATNALELGVDIGGLDAAVLAGYPGTIAGTWQQAGRSGRKDKLSISILVTSSNPLDQYLALHPEFLFETNPECGLIDPNNLLIALSHLQCAAYELPFHENSMFGSFTIQQTQELLAVLQNMGKVHQSNKSYYWMDENYPAAAVSLRTSSSRRITLQVQDSDNQLTTLGVIDKESSLWMVHPGAIYLHEGEIYHVNNLDLELQKALLIPTSNDFYTEAERQTNFSVINQLKADPIQGGTKYLGEIQVLSQVTGYKKIKWQPYEVLSRESLDLPPTLLNTMGFWLTLSEETESQLRSVGLWTSSVNNYGANWDSIRNAALARDHHTCKGCGKNKPGQFLHVHHKSPLRSFSSIEEANVPANLISLCPRCHQRAEAVVRVNSGIRGLGYILHSLAPLLLMCDPGDLGLYADFQSPLGDDRPVVLIFEYIPAGIGFSQSLFDREQELLEKAFELVSKCRCQHGCPSCVGPGGEQGSGGKEETLAILKSLCVKLI
ncbi:MAG: DEAD/DEAH box helicase [Anaerolineales bacterium]|nr:DEAD/DEAH box helicase [Anaerolineales bacterium]